MISVAHDSTRYFGVYGHIFSFLMSLWVHGFGVNLVESWLRKLEEMCVTVLPWSTYWEVWKQCRFLSDFSHSVERKVKPTGMYASGWHYISTVDIPNIVFKVLFFFLFFTDTNCGLQGAAIYSVSFIKENWSIHICS